MEMVKGMAGPAARVEHLLPYFSTANTPVLYAGREIRDLLKHLSKNGLTPEAFQTLKSLKTASRKLPTPTRLPPAIPIPEPVPTATRAESSSSGGGERSIWIE
jgi:hypothetical protein